MRWLGGSMEVRTEKHVDKFGSCSYTFVRLHELCTRDNEMPKSKLIGTKAAHDMINDARKESGLEPITMRAVQKYYIEKLGGVRIGQHWVFHLSSVERFVETIKRG